MAEGPNMTEDHHMMNGEQAVILQELCEKTGHPFSDQMTSDHADEMIDGLSRQREAEGKTA